MRLHSSTAECCLRKHCQQKRILPAVQCIVTKRVNTRASLLLGQTWHPVGTALQSFWRPAWLLPCTRTVSGRPPASGINVLPALASSCMTGYTISLALRDCSDGSQLVMSRTVQNQGRCTTFSGTTGQIQLAGACVRAFTRSYADGLHVVSNPQGSRFLPAY